MHATALNRLSKGDANLTQSVLGAQYEDFGVFAPSSGLSAPTTVPTATKTTSTTAPSGVFGKLLG